MDEKNYTGVVPKQHTGTAIDAESSLELDDETEAKAFFKEVKGRLQNVNDWHRLAGDMSANFQLTNKNGAEIYRNVQKGDYFKIDVPGPGTKSGDGYDWVQVEEIENTSTTPEVESFAIRVRPAENPKNSQNPKNKEKNIAHFYSPESTSSFTITREKNKITAAIYDRNTKTNEEADSAADKIRDAIVGAAGILSFSKIQWKVLTESLIKKE